MRTFLALTALLTALAAAGMSRADEKVPATAAATILAPLVDEQTFAIIHVDVSRVPAAPVLGLAAQVLPHAKKEIARTEEQIVAQREAFLRGGGRDIYLLVGLADFKLSDASLPLFAAVPLSAGTDAKLLAESLRKLGFEATQQREGVLLAGSRAALDRLKDVKPDPRPDLQQAFDAAGDAAAQIVFLPPVYWRRVIEEMMPTLPKPVGGGPSTVLTHGVRWAALGVDPPQNLSLRLVIQSADNQAAAALRDKWPDLWKPLKEEKDVSRVLPRLDDLLRLLTPEVRGDQLVIQMDAKKAGQAIPLLFTPASK
jgi:hypothetical protein